MVKNNESVWLKTMRTFLKFILHYIDPRSTFLGFLFLCATISIGLYLSFSKLFKIQLSNEIYWPAALAVTGFTLICFVKTRTKRYNTLCHLEVELNQAMDVVSNLQATLKNMIHHFVPVLWSHELPMLTPDNIKSVGRLDIKNNLGDLLCDFRRISQDWNNLIDFGRGHIDVIKDPKHPDHMEVRKSGTEALSLILNRANIAMKLIEDTLILIRVYMRTDEPFFRFKQPFVWPCELYTDICAERGKLNSERQQNN